MANSLLTTARLTLVLGVIGIAAVGCGRKGDLDRPSTPVEQQNIRKNIKESEKHPAPAPDRKFLLDPLL
ncbi:hypothetical protein EPK99_24700 [Neorhizobium lilium]|uniref:Lipoprotein n=1 Tax=Neorhizobium lilium TaxID=2503024 RepID=A0A444L9Y7_9HYPH|nr:hypothetical protein [Neorhizobium lilium]RWX74389.1 hypothetical protein EPK99_24700 [Neorhizobium lilium]